VPAAQSTRATARGAHRGFPTEARNQFVGIRVCTVCWYPRWYLEEALVSRFWWNRTCAGQERHFLPPPTWRKGPQAIRWWRSLHARHPDWIEALAQQLSLRCQAEAARLWPISRHVARGCAHSTQFSKQLSPTDNMVLKGSAEMKHMLASLTIGACLLLPSAGAVLGQPAKPAQNPTTGQQGSNHGFSCTTSGAGINTPGNAIIAKGAPFNPGGQAGVVYAGNPDTASAANANSTAAVSQYDVACSHQIP
jgi:hypothetical protein